MRQTTEIKLTYLQTPEKNMIKHFKIIGLYHKINFELKFNTDINILTGKNGAGKTTVMRLIWYLISGHIDKIIPAIDFDELEIETSCFKLKLTVSPSALNISWDIGNGEQTKTLNLASSEINKASEWLNQEILKVSHSSTFFPTFRHLEGGFVTDKPLKQEMGELYDAFHQQKIFSGLKTAFSDLSNYLSVKKHPFVTSVSTDDLTRLLTQQYAKISERIKPSGVQDLSWTSKFTSGAQDIRSPRFILDV
jgi:DNA repair ATPase RecN